MDPLPIVFILLFLPPFLFFIRRADFGAQISLRPIAAYDAIKRLLAQGAESGQPVHISVGTAGIASSGTADTAAGLQTLEYLADRAAVSAIPPLVTVADPTVLPIVQDHLRRAYQRQGYPEEHDPRRARFIAPTVNGSAVPYAVGVMDILAHEEIYANVMAGAFGPEFLLISETGAEKNLQQAGGTSAPAVLPFVLTTVEHPLLGEDLYAAGAYLLNKPAHIGSLLAQDTIRFLIVAFVLLGVLVSTFLGLK